MLEDGFLKSYSGSNLKDSGIDLKEFKEFIGRRSQKQNRARFIGEIKGDIKGNPFKGSFKNSSKSPLRELIGTDYPPLHILQAERLTFEMFIELINKTDYLLRRLISSLQEKDPYFSQEKQDDQWVKSLMEKYKK